MEYGIVISSRALRHSNSQAVFALFFFYPYWISSILLLCCDINSLKWSGYRLGKILKRLIYEYIYLKGRWKGREKGGEKGEGKRKRLIDQSIAWLILFTTSLPQCLQFSELDHAKSRNLEFHLGLLHWWQESKYLDDLLLPKLLSKKLDGRAE